MIRVRDLGKRYRRVTVLDGIDLSVDRRERLAVLGLNGAGKTTLIRCLMGLTDFTGRVEIDGHDVRRHGRLARGRLGYVPQRAPTFDGKLAEVIAFFCRLRGVAPTEAYHRMAELGLSIDEHGDKPVRALSGGMLQKSLLALALAADVPLLLLDEPTANLDPRARREFLRKLRDIEEERTIILATHRLSDVEAVANRLLVLHAGRIVFDGPTEQLWDRVGSSVTFWVRVESAERENARALMAHRWSSKMVRANGKYLGIELERERRADALMALREAGLTVEDFWTEAPTLHDLLEELLTSRMAPEAEGVARAADRF